VGFFLAWGFRIPLCLLNVLPPRANGSKRGYIRVLETNNPLAIMSIVCLSTPSMMKVNVVVAWEFQRHWILCHQMLNQ